MSERSNSFFLEYVREAEAVIIVTLSLNFSNFTFTFMCFSIIVRIVNTIILSALCAHPPTGKFWKVLEGFLFRKLNEFKALIIKMFNQIVSFHFTVPTRKNLFYLV